MVEDSVISDVLAKAIEVATHSWEYGTVAEAILEWRDSSLSIWNNPFPGGSGPKLDHANIAALSYAKPYIRTDNTTLVDGNGAAGDPPALGIPALMIGETLQPYYSAATRQLQHLMNDVPRWPNGAISHREAYPELWADFVYMVPPFLAYYAVASKDVTLLKEAVNQCKLYHDVLVTPEGPWLHVVGDHVQDLALWSTSNAWAAAGMSRVLATIKKSSYVEEMNDQQASLTGMIKGIVDGAIELDVDSSGLLRNYLNEPSWWGEISGTSLLAATAFRMAVLEPQTFGKKYTDWASKKLDIVDSKIDQSTGIVAPAINPLKSRDTTPASKASPEGQSFVVLMHAAYRDWKNNLHD